MSIVVMFTRYLIVFFNREQNNIRKIFVHFTEGVSNKALQKLRKRHFVLDEQYLIFS